MERGTSLDRIIAKEVLRLNRHLPERRKTLAELLEERRPKVVTRDGHEHFFDREELELLASVLPKFMHHRLKIPILIELGGYHGKAFVRGKAETRAVCEILGMEWSFRQESVELNMLEVRELRRRLPTTTQYMFSVDHVIGGSSSAGSLQRGRGP